VGRLSRFLTGWLVASCAAIAATLVAVPVASASPAPANASAYVPLQTPQRVYDTRRVGGAFAADEVRSIELSSAIANLGGLAPTAVVVNVTVLGPAAVGYWTVWPTGALRPESSGTNVDDVSARLGSTLALSNLVTLPLSGSSVSVYASGGGDLIVDVIGFYIPAVTATSGRLEPLASPVRILDSRNTTPMSPGEVRRLEVPGAIGASAVVLNVTVIGYGQGYWQVYQADGAAPTTSNVNTATLGDLAANNVITRVDPTGAVNIAASLGGHVIVDLVGVFTGPGSPSSSEGLFVPLANPSRFLDSRRSNRLYANSAVEVDVQAMLGRSDVAAVVMNATVTETIAPGYVSVTTAGASSDAAARATSSMNPTHSNQTLANHVVVPVSARGFDVFTQGGGHVIADVSGWYTGQPRAATYPRSTYSAPTTPAGCAGIATWPVGPIGYGTSADDVRRLQGRLLELGFWNLGADGEYGLSTKQAVMAFQKWAGLETSGRVDEATAVALTSAAARPTGQSSESGVVVEVDKDRQLLFIMNNGRLAWALNTSTGSGQYYLELNQKDPTKWELGRSVTDSGRFKVNRERPEGWWEGDLGEIYRPKYFNGGIAIHGSRSIPDYPASHGCVRVSTAAMDMIWASGLVPKGTAVWVYGADIEAEGEPPVMPTTTTTTTLAPTTSAPPAHSTSVAPA